MSLLVPVGLFVLGLVLVVTEVLVPSMGLLSLLAAASLIGALVTAFGISTATGVNFVVACALLVPAAIVSAMKLFPRTPIGRRMVVGGLSFDPAPATDARDLELVGRAGVVLSPLRPAGTARIDGRRVDVVSRGELVEAGTPVRVVEVRGNRVVVAPEPEPAEPAQSPGPAGPDPNRGKTP